MGDQKSGPKEAVSGVVEGVKGKAKEVGGTLTGHDDLKREGEAQQDKADAQRDAAKTEASKRIMRWVRSAPVGPDPSLQFGETITIAGDLNGNAKGHYRLPG